MKSYPQKPVPSIFFTNTTINRSLIGIGSISCAGLLAGAITEMIKTTEDKNRSSTAMALLFISAVIAGGLTFLLFKATQEAKEALQKKAPSSRRKKRRFHSPPRSSPLNPARKEPLLSV